MSEPEQAWKLYAEIEPKMKVKEEKPYLILDNTIVHAYKPEGDPDDPIHDPVRDVQVEGTTQLAPSETNIDIGDLVLSPDLTEYAVRAYDKHEKRLKNKFIKKVVGTVAVAALGFGWGISNGILDGARRASGPEIYIKPETYSNIDEQHDLAEITKAAKKTSNFSIKEYEKRKTKAVDSALDMSKMSFEPVFTASSTENSFEASRYYAKNQLEAFRNRLVVKEEIEPDGSSRIVFSTILSAVDVLDPINDQEITSTVAFGVEIPQGSNGKLTPKKVHEMLVSKDTRLADVSVTGANYTFEGQYEIGSDGSITRNGANLEGIEKQEVITDIHVIVDDFFDDQVKR